MSIFCENDVQTVREDQLMLAYGSHPELAGLSDPAILNKLRVSERDIARQLKVFLEPTVIFPYEPTDAEIEALDGKPWVEETGYDYDPDFFQGDSWGFMVLDARPIISVDRVRFAFPSQNTGLFEFPKEWIRVDKKAGQLRMIPINQAVTMPLNIFLMQALGGGRSIPYMLQVNYTAGLKDVKTNWPDLVDVIVKNAVLSMVKGAFKPQSGSISADGLSQSASFDTDKYEDVIQHALFGPKGSNGGFWTAIHGLPGTALGAGR